MKHFLKSIWNFLLWLFMVNDEIETVKEEDIIGVRDTGRCSAQINGGIEPYHNNAEGKKINECGEVIDDVVESKVAIPYGYQPWNRQDTIIALYLAIFGIQNIGSSMVGIAEDMERTLHSLEAKIARLRSLRISGGASRVGASELDKEVFNFYKGYSEFNFRIAMIEAMLTLTDVDSRFFTNRAWKRKLEEELSNLSPEDQRKGDSFPELPKH